MSSLLSNVSVGAITIFTEDLARSRAFYLDVFGKPVIFEDENSAVFKFGDTVINVLAVSAAPSWSRPAPSPRPAAASAPSCPSRSPTSTPSAPNWPSAGCGCSTGR